MSAHVSIVGTGIMLGGHLTAEARSLIADADCLYYLVADPATVEALEGLNPNAVSLHECYAAGTDRKTSYEGMADAVLRCAKQGKSVCLALYGHPGVFVSPSHAIMRAARSMGIECHMTPGISAEDCLFADAGIDPALCGCQSFEATDFLIYDRVFDVRSVLVLWQVGVVGEAGFSPEGYRNAGLPLLIARLRQFYPASHRVMIYEAAQYPVCSPRMQWVELSGLGEAGLTAISTLYVPPGETAVPNPDVIQKLSAFSSYWNERFPAPAPA